MQKIIFLKLSKQNLFRKFIFVTMLIIFCWVQVQGNDTELDFHNTPNILRLLYQKIVSQENKLDILTELVKIQQQTIANLSTKIQAQSNCNDQLHHHFKPRHHLPGRQNSTVLPKNEIPKTLQSDTPCNSVLTSVEGSISYKFGVNYPPNERCIWAISAAENNRSTFTLQLVSSGLEIGDEIHVAAFQGKDEIGWSLEAKVFNMKLRTNHPVSVDGDSLVIVFTSQAHNRTAATGFQINYKVDQVDFPIKIYKPIIINGLSNGTVAHPHKHLSGEGHQLNHNEVATILINPPINRRITTHFTSKGGKDAHPDNVSIFSFHNEDGFVFNRWLTGGNATFHNEGPIVVVFQSGIAINNLGFEVGYQIEQ